MYRDLGFLVPSPLISLTSPVSSFINYFIGKFEFLSKFKRTNLQFNINHSKVTVDY